ncbi:MAG: hypothetical protein NC300_03960 [Bacteroidales bacterium]|nr:hypothetical protein [Clostridium sp.]MCM1203276.1 hypothetical protein [Bacteroidales bacterium]
MLTILIESLIPFPCNGFASGFESFGWIVKWRNISDAAWNWSERRNCGMGFHCMQWHTTHRRKEGDIDEK